MLRKLLLVLGMAVGIILVSSATFCIVDKVHEESSLRARVHIAERELWLARSEYDATRAEADYLLLANEDLAKRVNEVSEERNYWIRKHGHAEGQSRRITEERIACENRERDHNTALETGH